jgi:1-deoxy-D-xylulose-5-phosphate synthase
MTVLAPAHELDLSLMIRFAISLGTPVAIRYPRGEVVGLDGEGFREEIEFGKGRLLKEGMDMAILAVGSCVHPSLEAALRLEEHGISARVIDGRFVKPIDLESIRSGAIETGKIVTVEENVLAGGFGSAVLEALSDEKFRGVEVLRLGIDDRFLEQGTQKELRSSLGIDDEGIFQHALTFVQGKVPQRASTSSPLRADIGKIIR